MSDGSPVSSPVVTIGGPPLAGQPPTGAASTSQANAPGAQPGPEQAGRKAGGDEDTIDAEFEVK